jgi:hypothetical protein
MHRQLLTHKQQTGVTAKTYNNAGYNNAPPLPGDNRLLTTTTVNNIDFQWGGGQVLNSGLHDDVAVKFTSQLTAPVTGTIYFFAPADDGTILQLNGTTVINDWYDKGGGGSIQTYNVTQGTPMDMTFWFYENGGGAGVTLMWNLGNGWEVIPSSAFTNSTATLAQVTAFNNAQTILNIETQQLATATATSQTAQTNLTQAQQNLLLAQQADAAASLAAASVTSAINAINEAEVVVDAMPASIHTNLTPTITSVEAGDRAVVVEVIAPPGETPNTWFYQVIAA